MVPRLYLGCSGLPSQPELVSPETLLQRDTTAGSSCRWSQWPRPTLPRAPEPRQPRPRADTVSDLFLVPVVLLHLLLSVHRYWAWQFGDEPSLGNAMIVSMLGMVVPWVVVGPSALDGGVRGPGSPPRRPAPRAGRQSGGVMAG